MKRIFVLSTTLVAVLLCLAAALLAKTVYEPSIVVQRVFYNEIGKSILIDGDFDRPVGSVIKIQGYKESNGPLVNWFWVESVDGKLLESKRGIGVSGISKWKDGTKATFIGHERGILRFHTLGETNVDNDSTKGKGPNQILTLFFEVERIEDPSGLKLDKEQD